MGEVYRARDNRLDREVAIKVLPEEVSNNPDALRRFEREAKALAALSHPNILSIHDVGRQECISYVVTELVVGDTLRAALRGGALSWEKCLAISIAVAEGLTAAHSKGVIHRDLKPENIFLSSDGSVKILDFGLARRNTSGDNSSASQIETATEVISGTVPYMSPEQAKGEVVDSRTDLFSFGCVLYEMVSGKRPFDGKSTAEVLASILKEDPPPIRKASPELQRIIAHCLEKAPEQRFQSARDLSYDLKSFGTRVSIVSIDKPRSVGLRLGLAIMIALLMAAVLIYNASRQPSAPINSIAVLPFTNVTGDPETEYLTDGIAETIINRLSQLPNVKVVSRTSAFRYKGQETDPKRISSELNVRAVLVGRVQQRGENLSVSTELIDTKDDTQLWGEQYNRKISDILAMQNDIAREISENLKDDLQVQSGQN